jgi:hypothetical protein
MAVHISESLRAFYDTVWQRAVSSGASRWCQIVELPSGIDALLPNMDQLLTAQELMAWPVLPERVTWVEGSGVSGWVPSPDKMRAAFTAILRDRHPDGDYSLRQDLRVAELHVNAQELTPAQKDLVLQIAVFGRVLFR